MEDLFTFTYGHMIMSVTCKYIHEVIVWACDVDLVMSTGRWITVECKSLNDSVMKYIKKHFEKITDVHYVRTDKSTDYDDNTIMCVSSNNKIYSRSGITKQNSNAVLSGDSGFVHIGNVHIKAKYITFVKLTDTYLAVEAACDMRQTIQFIDEDAKQMANKVHESLVGPTN